MFIFNDATAAYPLFAADGYHLLPVTEAMDRGVTPGATTDVDGEARDAAPDLGADEVTTPGVYASPELLEVKGCNSQPETHTLQLLNHTGASGDFNLAYAAGPGLTMDGPATIALNPSGWAGLVITLTPNSCPVIGTALTETVTLSGNSYTATTAISKTIAAGWEEWTTLPESLTAAASAVVSDTWSGLSLKRVEEPEREGSAVQPVDNRARDRF
jgi:hypothetical protein